jgi:hypothetical protein
LLFREIGGVLQEEADQAFGGPRDAVTAKNWSAGSWSSSGFRPVKEIATGAKRNNNGVSKATRRLGATGLIASANMATRQRAATSLRRVLIVLPNIIALA